MKIELIEYIAGNYLYLQVWENSKIPTLLGTGVYQYSENKIVRHNAQKVVLKQIMQ